MGRSLRDLQLGKPDGTRLPMGKNAHLSKSDVEHLEAMSPEDRAAALQAMMEDGPELTRTPVSTREQRTLASHQESRTTTTTHDLRQSEQDSVYMNGERLPDALPGRKGNQVNDVEPGDSVDSEGVEREPSPTPHDEIVIDHPPKRAKNKKNPQPPLLEPQGQKVPLFTENREGGFSVMEVDRNDAQQPGTSGEGPSQKKGRRKEKIKEAPPGFPILESEQGVRGKVPGSKEKGVKSRKSAAVETEQNSELVHVLSEIEAEKLRNMPEAVVNDANVVDISGVDTNQIESATPQGLTPTRPTAGRPPLSPEVLVIRTIDDLKKVPDKTRTPRPTTSRNGQQTDANHQKNATRRATLVNRPDNPQDPGKEGFIRGSGSGVCEDGRDVQPPVQKDARAPPLRENVGEKHPKQP